MPHRYAFPCSTKNCSYEALPNSDICGLCASKRMNQDPQVQVVGTEPTQDDFERLVREGLQAKPKQAQSLSQRYPKYYKDVSDLDEIDVYLVHDRFKLEDHSGCLHHASKKILLPGVRTGGKSRYDDIKEARDTLTRWLQINEHLKPEGSE